MIKSTKQVNKGGPRSAFFTGSARVSRALFVTCEPPLFASGPAALMCTLTRALPSIMLLFAPSGG
jgi:hypothetical protein